MGTGVRLSTALNIKIKDVDFDSGFIFLGTTKNRIQQYIPLAKSLENVLKDYLSYRGGEDDDFLFCNSYGRKANDRTYQQMVKDYNNQRGVDKSSCHAFRHTFAKLFLINGGDLFSLQKIFYIHLFLYQDLYQAVFSLQLQLYSVQQLNKAHTAAD